MADEIRTRLHSLLITYPEDVPNKREYKHKLLREHPESLRADLKRDGTVPDLVFYTPHIDAWHKVLCSHYTNHRTRGLKDGRQIKINRNGSDQTLTVNIYHTGIVMFQGTEVPLSSVLDDFDTLKNLKDEMLQEQLHLIDQATNNLSEHLQNLHVSQKLTQNEAPAQPPSTQPGPPSQSQVPELPSPQARSTNPPSGTTKTQPEPPSIQQGPADQE
ncbi:uncharacterized protein LOC131370212 [Hemibagrus wyckioides]|uniref:uncharacterized protein LOC131370212 n=1 Tax=Hemibagrus wyckioides TaxID=337641 RepID=UPI00266C4015|nr:uncharacterized protein LOC131370212 [Hemibagrus wyckioides]XP_058273393.1 uncharacterized protein LOC131370212 [Hemibagrus wyckioides]